MSCGWNVFQSNDYTAANTVSQSGTAEEVGHDDIREENPENQNPNRARQAARHPGCPPDSPVADDWKVPVTKPPTDQGQHGQRNCSQRQHSLRQDRKSTRLNSSHGYISYAVFCL